MLVAAGTIGLAVVSFAQVKQASRSVKAMEDANQISVAIAQAAEAPRFAVRLDTIDSVLPSGDSVTCRVQLRLQNEDSKPIRVVSMYSRVDSSQAPTGGILQGVMGTESVIQVDSSSEFPNFIRLRLPRNTDSMLITWLHVCAAVRLDGPAGTRYVERVYLLGTNLKSGVIYSHSYWCEYTGLVNELSVRLDPWSDQMPLRLIGKAGIHANANPDHSDSYLKR